MNVRPFHPLHIAIGLTIWSVWFVGVYGGLSVGCAVAPPAPQAGAWNWLNGALGLFTILTVALLVGLSVHCGQAARRAGRGRRNERFVARVSAALYLVAAFATLYVGVPIAALPPCI